LAVPAENKELSAAYFDRQKLSQFSAGINFGGYFCGGHRNLKAAENYSVLFAAVFP
jgi:hypothetical protein